MKSKYEKKQPLVRYLWPLFSFCHTLEVSIFWRVKMHQKKQFFTKKKSQGQRCIQRLDEWHLADHHCPRDPHLPCTILSSNHLLAFGVSFKERRQKQQHCAIPTQKLALFGKSSHSYHSSPSPSSSPPRSPPFSPHFSPSASTSTSLSVFPLLIFVFLFTFTSFVHFRH